MAQRYSQRPSSLINIDDPGIALDFDAAVAYLGIREQERLIKKAPEPSDGKEGMTALKNLVNKSRRAKGLQAWR